MVSVEDIALIVKHYCEKSLKKQTGIKLLDFIWEKSSITDSGRWRTVISYSLLFAIKHTVNKPGLCLSMKEDMNKSLAKRLNLIRYDKCMKEYMTRDDFSVVDVITLNKNRTGAGKRGNITYLKVQASIYLYDDTTIETDLKYAVRDVKLAQLRINI